MSTELEKSSGKPEVAEKKRDLKEAIGVLYEMETNDYMMTRMIQTINRKIKTLGNPRRLVEPVKEKASLDMEITVRAALLGGMLGAGIGVLTGCPNISVSGGILGLIGTLLGSLLICTVVGAFIGALIGFMIDSSRNAHQKAEQQRIYQQAYEAYQKQKAAEQARLAREEQHKTALIAERNALVGKRNASRALTADLYEMVGIDSRFRTFISITYMYDYVRLGISNKLEGVDGLYYLIQQRLQWDYINLKLEDIVSKLDTIINNQDSLYHELRNLNTKCDGMMNMMERSISVGIENGRTLNEIRDSSAASAYEQERIRREYEIHNWITYYR